MTQKLTLTELMKNKEKYQPKDNATQELFIDRIGATITIKKADRSLVLEAIELANDDNFEGNSDAYFVYNIVVEPNLKDAELQKSFGCVEPTDIVEQIFEIGEIASIAQEGMKLSGYNNGVKAVKDLKN